MEQMQMNMPDMYDAALYLRLSKDDMEEGGAKSHYDWENTKTDNYSSKNCVLSALRLAL